VDFEVAWTEAATADLQAITKYIAEHNSDAAERIALAIHQRVSLLRSVPLMGKVYSRGGRPDVRVVVSGKYRIFYRVIQHSAIRPAEFPSNYITIFKVAISNYVF
jgi:plasmid stabilization system protein ParE